jgi:hypothetical protein
METASPDLVLEYRVTESDYVSACLTHCRSSGPLKLFLYYLLPILGVASILLGGIVAALEVRAEEDWTLSIVFVVVGLFWIGCFSIRPWRLKRAYRKDPRFKSPMKIAIVGNEWNVSTATAEARYKEGTFIRAVDTDSFYLFYHSPLMFNIIPKHDLTPDQRTQVEAFLDRALPIHKGRVRLPAAA